MSNIINPLTGRRIKIGGTLYHKLVKDGTIQPSIDDPTLYDLVPKEIIEEIALRTPIQGIGSLCHLDVHLRERCKDRSFWINYLHHRGIDTEYHDPQDRLHHLFIELAKEGDWTLFDFLWRTDLKLIKENRSLSESYEVAYKNGKYEVANKIWKLNNSKNFFIGHRFHRGSKDALDLMLYSELIAEMNDLETFKETIKGVTKYLGNDYVYGAAAYSDSDDFISELVKYLKELDEEDEFDYSPELFIYELLAKGKFGLADTVVSLEDQELGRDDVTFSMAALNSSREDSFSELYSYNIHADADELTAEFIDRFTEGEGVAIGSPILLSGYASKYHEDHQTLLLSFKTFPAKQFYRFYKETAKCYSQKERKEFLSTLDHQGYDYLYSLFVEGMPICN